MRLSIQEYVRHAVGSQQTDSKLPGFVSLVLTSDIRYLGSEQELFPQTRGLYQLKTAIFLRFKASHANLRA